MHDNGEDFKLGRPFSIAVDMDIFFLYIASSFNIQSFYSTLFNNLKNTSNKNRRFIEMGTRRFRRARWNKILNISTQLCCDISCLISICKYRLKYEYIYRSFCFCFLCCIQEYIMLICFCPCTYPVSCNLICYYE